MISGAFDTLSHAMETYLGNSDQDNVSDDLALAVMRNTVVNMRRLLKNMDDMQARSNLMWDSAMAENGILKVGRVTDFQAHQIEHQLGAFTDCNHGQGLAVIHPAYYRHILKDAQEKFERFAKEVFGKDTAEEGIQALVDFIRECGLPVKMGELKSKVEITPEVLRKVADTCNIIKCNPRELTRDDFHGKLLLGRGRGQTKTTQWKEVEKRRHAPFISEKWLLDMVHTGNLDYHEVPAQAGAVSPGIRTCSSSPLRPGGKAV